MPSFMTHAVVGLALGQASRAGWGADWRFWCMAVFCSVLPDVDALGFRVGIPYGSVWGHRGLTHSLAFAALVAPALGSLVRCPLRHRWKPVLLLFVITASHGVLDAMTSGGLGVAFFAPFDSHRYFLPWRPIRVSPISIRAFLSARGFAVLRSELLWVWIPAFLLALFLRFGYSSEAGVRRQRAGRT